MPNVQRLLSGLFVALCRIAVPPAGFAASVEVLPRPSVYAIPELAGVQHTLRIAGTIETGDADTVRDRLMRLTGGRPDTGLLVAEMSGGGGDYLEAMQVGQVLRD